MAVWPPNVSTTIGGVAGQRALVVDDVEHALGVERLEVEPRAGVVVGAHRLGVVVDDDGVEPHLANGPRCPHAAVVELDPLPDPDRSGPDHDDAASLGRRRDLRLGVAGVEVGRLGRELAGAGVDATVGGVNAGAHSSAADGRPRHARHGRDVRVAEADALRLGERRSLEGVLGLNQLRQPLGEPRRDARSQRRAPRHRPSHGAAARSSATGGCRLARGTAPGRRGRGG